MKRRKPKKIVFVACEGRSEESYVKMLSLFANEMSLGIHINKASLNGGSRSAMAEKAISLYRSKSKHGEFFPKAIFLDTDNAAKKEISEITKNLEKHGFIIIWQRPNHEAFLWRHLKDKNQNPPDPGKIKRDIKQHWPDYEKNHPADDLKKKIDLPKVIEVARSLENEGYDGFLVLLEEIGLLKG